MEMHDSDKELPPQSTPPQPASAPLSSTTPSITSSCKCKHIALESASESFWSSSFGSGPSKKRQHGSAGVFVLGGIKDSIDKFKTIMCTGMPVAQICAADQAAAYQVQAMDKVQTEEPDLDDDQVVVLMDLFRTNLSAVEAYMAIVRPAIHKAWLNKQLKQLGFPNQVPDVDQWMIE